VALLNIVVLARPAARFLERLQALPDVRVTVGENAEALASAAPEADVVLTAFRGRDVLEDVFRRTPRVRWVHSLSAGIDHVLFPALVESPVPLTNASGVFSAALAEFALAGLLFFAKDLRRMVRSQMAGVWDPFDVTPLAGRTLGIVGFGDIGRATARVARGAGMRILAVRRHPTPSDPDADDVVPPQRLHELLGRVDDVAVTLPLTPETRGLIGARELALLKSHAVLVNVGRGPLVDEAALVRALEARQLRGAALDVFETEPLPAGHPFYRLDNVLLSPHCADHTPGWQESTLDFFLENLARFRAGQPLENVVDKRRGY
jgi:phosphoglycerate dehydrogenase-like enzyme